MSFIFFSENTGNNGFLNMYNLLNFKDKHSNRYFYETEMNDTIMYKYFLEINIYIIFFLKILSKESNMFYRFLFFFLNCNWSSFFKDFKKTEKTISKKYFKHKLKSKDNKISIYFLSNESDLLDIENLESKYNKLGILRERHKHFEENIYPDLFKKLKRSNDLYSLDKESKIYFKDHNYFNKNSDFFFEKFTKNQTSIWNDNIDSFINNNKNDEAMLKILENFFFNDDLFYNMNFLNINFIYFIYFLDNLNNSYCNNNNYLLKQNNLDYFFFFKDFSKILYNNDFLILVDQKIIYNQKDYYNNIFTNNLINNKNDFLFNNYFYKNKKYNNFSYNFLNIKEGIDVNNFFFKKNYLHK